MYTFDSATISKLANGTYCKSTNQEVITDETSEGRILRCDIVGYPGMDVCPKTVGSHSVTFYSYLAARMAFDWTFKGVYALLDGTSLRQEFIVGLCRFRFQKNRNSDSLTVYGLFSGIDSVIVGQKNRKMNKKGIVF